MSTKCGCDNSGSTEGEYLVIKATSSEAAACGDPSSTTGSTACAKQEPMFDESLSDFLIPSEASSVPMQVCNAEIYTVGMWIEFVNPVAKLQISAITGNVLTLLNRNANGDEVFENPNIGSVIAKYTRFVVCQAPVNMDAAQRLEDIKDALAVATELCVPNLSPSTSTAIVHPVGRVESDPSNLSVGKCLRRIYGILFNAGRPVLTALGEAVPIDDAMDYRPLIKHKTSNTVRQRKNYSETSGLGSGRQYMLVTTNASERLIGPTYVFRDVRTLVDTSAVSAENPTGWPNFSNNKTHDWDLSNITGILSAVPSPEIDHYFALVKLEIAGNFAGGGTARTMLAQLNDFQACRCSVATDSQGVNFNAITALVKVLKTNHKLELKLSCDGTQRYWYRVGVEALYY